MISFQYFAWKSWKPIITTLLLSGDSTVGKSALIQVFVSDGAQYPKTYNMVNLFAIDPLKK